MKRNVIRGSLFILVCIIWMGILTEVMKPKMMEGFSDVTRKIRGFYAEEENSLDYIFFGSSRMYSALNPAILWNEYGVTSYAFCCNEQAFPVTYYYMQEALARQKPKAVIVDISFGGIETREPMLHLNLDFSRFSLNKIAAIRDNADGMKILDYLFPIRQWHTNWYSLVENNFRYSFWEKNNLYRGYSYVEMDEPIEMPQYNYPYDMTENMELYYMEPLPEVLEYIDKMVELAQKYGVELVFVTVPDGSAPENQGYYNGIFQYVNDRDDVTCMNYNLKMAGMHHLTSDLAEDFTRLVGKDLAGMFEVRDKRGWSGYESWDESVSIYRQEMKAESMNDIVMWSDYIELLKDTNYRIYIEQIPWNCDDETWSKVKKGLEGIGANALLESTVNYMAIIDMSNHENNREYVDEKDKSIEERDGQLYYKMKQGAIILNNQVFPCEEGLKIVVYDKKLQRVVDTVLIQSGSLNLQRS
ncbi:MAG: hypothetical protein ACI4DR_04900 [Roseburia sp.]